MHEADKSSGRREQQVDIYLSFIGRFEVPGQNVEIEPFDPAEHRKSQYRAYYYRHRGKILAEKAEQTSQKKAAKLAAQPVKTPEEIEAELQVKIEHHRAYQRKYQREWKRKRREQKQTVQEIEPA